MKRLKFEMWRYERKPGEFDGVMSRFTDGKGTWSDSWWCSPPKSIDHVGEEYLQQPHRHPNVRTKIHDTFIKRRYKEEMMKLSAGVEG
ncbi:hypothetical protein GJU41_12645 [Bacillus idriensis]|uniref:Uncharacterized protein n=1 Tax=Metabacillus idriensis TaxID=324768 RepID=A0A6I2MG99_9BACI|nr:hypothetical protein [Metabacillus idriensis]MRX54823.1 hypothetical protein [Metabacillus idriensis]